MIEKGDVQSAVDALRLEAIGWVHMCGQSGNLLHVPCLTTHIAQANNILVSGLPSCAHSLRYNTYTASSSSTFSSFPSSSTSSTFLSSSPISGHDEQGSVAEP